ncbi:MAG: two-component response regulator MtrA, partial [Actinomycetota bacterium]
ELAARIRAALRRVQLHETSPVTTAVSRFGDVELRREQGIVLKAGVELNLTKTEFRLLCEFADHANMVLSRDQLLERVWGYEYLGDSRLVDAHVRRLRVKIEDQPDDPKLIVTARGVGYRLLP